MYGTTESRHSDIACAIAAQDDFAFGGWDKYADERGWSGVGIGPVGHHRDGDALERANWDAAVAELDRVDPDMEHHEEASFGHWAVGWVAEMTYDLGHAPTCEAVERMRSELEAYPVLDEERWCEYEWEDNHPDDEYCYSDSECHVTDDNDRIVLCPTCGEHDPYYISDNVEVAVDQSTWHDITDYDIEQGYSCSKCGTRWAFDDYTLEWVTDIRDDIPASHKPSPGQLALAL